MDSLLHKLAEWHHQRTTDKYRMRQVKVHNLVDIIFDKAVKADKDGNIFDSNFFDNTAEQQNKFSGRSQSAFLFSLVLLSALMLAMATVFAGEEAGLIVGPIRVKDTGIFIDIGFIILSASLFYSADDFTKSEILSYFLVKRADMLAEKNGLDRSLYYNFSPYNCFRLLYLAP